MTNFMKWFDRSFDFDLQSWMYPNIVERLRGTPARAEDRTRGLGEAALTKRLNDGWSIQEHIGHLADLEPLWLERLRNFEAGDETLVPADLENRKTHEANHNQTPFEEILAVFHRERATIIQRLDSYDERFIERTAKHPRLQTDMRVLDLVFFIAEHDDHHLARITSLIGAALRGSDDALAGSGEAVADRTGTRVGSGRARAGDDDALADSGGTRAGGDDTLADRNDGGQEQTGAAVVGRFVKAINSHDTDSICDLVTDDHVLVDSGGHVIQGTDLVRKAWDGYFAMFPDYRITAADIIEKPPWFTVVGSAQGTYVADGGLKGENSWSIPAAWLAGVRGGKVRHWQVYADNEPVRRILDRYHGG